MAVVSFGFAFLWQIDAVSCCMLKNSMREMVKVVTTWIGLKIFTPPHIINCSEISQ